MVLTDWQTCDRDHIPVDKKSTASLTAWALPGGKVHCGVQSERSARESNRTTRTSMISSTLYSVSRASLPF